MEELKAEVEKRVRERNEALADGVLRSNALRWLRDNVRVDLPVSLLDRKADRDGDTPDDEVIVIDGEDVDHAARAEALGLVGVAFACEAVLDQEGVEVSEEEVRAEYMAFGATHGLSASLTSRDDIPSQIASTFRDELARRKATSIIAENATRKVVPLSEMLERGDDDDEEPQGADESSEEPDDA